MDENYYNTFDLPIPYKNLLLYPIKVKDYLFFSTYAQCLTIDKNSIPDPKIISMTDLEYIYTKSIEDINKYPYLLYLDRMLALCLKDDTSFNNIEESIKRYSFDENQKPFFIINGEKFTSKDFLQLKNLIARQDMVELIDESVSKDVRDSLEKARLYKSKRSGNKSVSYEDYIVSLSSVTGWTCEYIYEMTIRKFLKTIKRVDNYMHYKIYLAASMSGMVEFKDKSFIKHWLSNIDTDDKYEGVSVDLDKVKNTISFESAKK